MQQQQRPNKSVKISLLYVKAHNMDKYLCCQAED